jgi:hypothetical protein
MFSVCLNHVAAYRHSRLPVDSRVHRSAPAVPSMCAVNLHIEIAEFPVIGFELLLCVLLYAH